MKNAHSSVLGVGVAIALTIPSQGPAQDMINNLPDYTSAWVMGDLMQRRGRDYDEPAERPGAKNRKAAEAREQASATELLEQAIYRPSPDPETRIEHSFTAYLEGRENDGPTPELLRAVMEDNPVGSPFARLLASAVGGGERRAIHQVGRDYADWLASKGYSERNLFDVHTAFLLHAWSIANSGVTISDTDNAFRAIRNGLVDMQARAESSKLLRRDSAQKQEEAQSFALMTALLVSTWSSADPGGRLVLTKGTDALGRRIGADFRRLKLTPDGLFPE